MNFWLKIGLLVPVGFVLCCAGVLGCGHSAERIRFSSDGKRPDSAQIDSHRWALLPPGAVIWMSADGAAFDSDFGAPLIEAMVARLPLSASLQFQPQKSITGFSGAFYATVGSDIVVICEGNFDAQKIASAFSENQVSSAGATIIRADYAGATMYVAHLTALSVLTEHTMVWGTQLGVRRVLEVVEENRMRSTVPPWYEALLQEKGANFTLGIDLDSQAVPAVFSTKFEYLNHLRAGRILGNFDEPGLNFAGSLSFADPASAERAAQVFNNIVHRMDAYDLLFRALGVKPPVKSMEAAQTGKEVQLAAQLKGKSVVALLGQGKLSAADIQSWLPN